MFLFALPAFVWYCSGSYVGQSALTKTTMGNLAENSPRISEIELGDLLGVNRRMIGLVTSGLNLFSIILFLIFMFKLEVSQHCQVVT